MLQPGAEGEEGHVEVGHDVAREVREAEALAEAAAAVGAGLRPAVHAQHRHEDEHDHQQEACDDE